jgi:hypothetical protein
MFAWMIAGTRVGLARGAALALGIDTVFSGRENGSGVCWPAELPPDRMPRKSRAVRKKPYWAFAASADPLGTRRLKRCPDAAAD